MTQTYLQSELEEPINTDSDIPTVAEKLFVEIAKKIGTHQQRKLAVLIDAENIGPDSTGALFTEIAKLGDATVRRAYGNWTTSNLTGWKTALLEYSILPMQQFNNTNGKNSTDIALVIAAMDLLHTRNFDGFCLVSSDSDFTRLASRIREEGKAVYGFGAKQTPKALISSCTKFIYLENLQPPRTFNLKDDPELRDTIKNAVDETKSPLPYGILNPNDDHEFVDAIKNIVEEYANDDGWVHTNRFGGFIDTRFPGFSPGNYGCRKMTEVLAQLEEFQVERITTSEGKQPLMIRLK